MTQGSVRIEVPLVVTISLGTPGTAATRVEAVEAATAALAGEGLEALVEPEHDTRYSNRKGYDPGFLNVDGEDGPEVEAPMPAAASSDVLARTTSGDDALSYQNFSIVMHAKRKLALFTASNISAEKALRQPEAGMDYTRGRGLPRWAATTGSSGFLIRAWLLACSCPTCSTRGTTQGLRQGAHRAPR